MKKLISIIVAALASLDAYLFNAFQKGKELLKTKFPKIYQVYCKVKGYIKCHFIGNVYIFQGSYEVLPNVGLEILTFPSFGSQVILRFSWYKVHACIIYYSKNEDDTTESED